MHSIAVVPIFMSAGAAALPTIMAAAASVVAIILKPRELIRLVRQRPGIAGLTVVVVTVLAMGVRWLVSPNTAARADSHIAARSQIDWAKVAEDLLARQLAGAGAATAVIATEEHSKAPLIQGHDSSRGSYAGGPSPIKLNPLWSFRPEDGMFLSQPVVSGNRIYTAACQADLGNYTGLLACLDAETGKPIWKIDELNNVPLPPFFSSPALTADGSSLLIGQGLHQDHDCALLCFDATTGKLRWSVKTPLHIESSPAIFGDLAVVGAGAIEGKDGKPTGNPGYVVAVRISDGKELWRQQVNDPESSPAVDADGMVYSGSGFNGSAIVAIRSEPDEQLREKKLERVAWRTPVEYPVNSAIALIDDLVIAGGGNGDVVHSNLNPQGQVVALDRKTGAVKWQVAFEDSVLGGVAARGGIVICPIRTGEVAALSSGDGKILWRTRVSGDAPVLAGCAFTGERVYAVSSDGYLAVIDAKDGKVLEKTYLNDQAKPSTGLSMSAPQIVNGRVIVGSETGGLRCLVGSGSDK